MKPILYLVLLLISSSCSDNDINIKVDMPTHNPKVVVDGIYKADETIKIYVGESSGVFDNIKPPIEDATVKLYKNKILLETLTYNSANDYYVSENIAEIDTEYSIIVSTPDFDAVTAVSHTPKPPILASWEYGGYEYSSDEWNTHFLRIDIQDDININNYYEVKTVVSDIEGIDWFLGGEMNVGNEQEPVFNNEVSPQNIFSDVLFNGTTYGLDCKFNIPIEVTSFNLSVKLRSVTKDYYDYHKKLYQHLEAADEGNLFYIEPVQLFTNIQEGYGVFTGYSEIEQVVIDN